MPKAKENVVQMQYAYQIWSPKNLYPQRHISTDGQKIWNLEQRYQFFHFK